LIAALSTVLIAVSITCARATQVEIPLNLDYLLLDAAVKQRFYTGPDERAELWNGADNCGHFYAIDPRLSRAGTNVQLATQSDFEAALAVAGRCLNAMSWKGNLVATTAPRITGFTIKFPITDLNFYGGDGTTSGRTAFGLIKSALIDQLGSFSYDLHPQLQHLQTMADGLPAAAAVDQLRAVLASLRPAQQVVPQDDGVEVGVQMDVPQSLMSRSAAPLTPAEKAGWQSALSGAGKLVTATAAQAQALIQDPQLRDEVAQIAADSRTRVTTAANAPPADSDPMPLFRDDWRRLRAALKAAARRGSLGDQTVMVLAATTVGDAIFALDERVPGLGSQLSRAGAAGLRLLPPLDTWTVWNK
jgi:hypothetical protein